MNMHDQELEKYKQKMIIHCGICVDGQKYTEILLPAQSCTTID